MFIGTVLLEKVPFLTFETFSCFRPSASVLCYLCHKLCCGLWNLLVGISRSNNLESCIHHNGIWQHHHKDRTYGSHLRFKQRILLTYTACTLEAKRIQERWKTNKLSLINCFWSDTSLKQSNAPTKRCTRQWTKDLLTLDMKFYFFRHLKNQLKPIHNFLPFPSLGW